MLNIKVSLVPMKKTSNNVDSKHKYKFWWKFVEMNGKFEMFDDKVLISIKIEQF